jgi:SAM-dependent methyltransferase
MTDTPAQFADVSRFTAVDDAADPQQLIDVLDAAKRLPGFPAAKAQLLDLLEPERASSALDVGCGYGADVVALAQRLIAGGRAVGVDVSENMIAEARRRTAGTEPSVGFRIGDALALPFEAGTFDICRVETVLQHLADPGRAVTEMARVTRPGGRVGALELDQATMFLDHPDTELLETLCESVLSAMVQPAIGRQVPRLFAEAGLIDVRTAPTVILGDPHAWRLMLAHGLGELCDRGTISADRASRWWTAMDDAAASGHFVGGVTALVVAGTVA